MYCLAGEILRGFSKERKKKKVEGTGTKLPTKNINIILKIEKKSFLSDKEKLCYLFTSSLSKKD